MPTRCRYTQQFKEETLRLVSQVGERSRARTWEWSIWALRTPRIHNLEQVTRQHDHFNGFIGSNRNMPVATGVLV